MAEFLQLLPLFFGDAGTYQFIQLSFKDRL